MLKVPSAMLRPLQKCIYNEKLSEKIIRLINFSHLCLLITHHTELEIMKKTDWGLDKIFKTDSIDELISKIIQSKPQEHYALFIHNSFDFMKIKLLCDLWVKVDSRDFCLIIISEDKASVLKIQRNYNIETHYFSSSILSWRNEFSHFYSCNGYISLVTFLTFPKYYYQPCMDPPLGMYCKSILFRTICIILEAGCKIDLGELLKATYSQLNTIYDSQIYMRTLAELIFIKKMIKLKLRKNEWAVVVNNGLLDSYPKEQEKY